MAKLTLTLAHCNIYTLFFGLVDLIYSNMQPECRFPGNVQVNANILHMLCIYSSSAGFGNLHRIHFPIIFKDQCGMSDSRTVGGYFLSSQAIRSISSFLSQNLHKPNGKACLCPWSSLNLWTSGRRLQISTVSISSGINTDFLNVLLDHWDCPL